MVREKWNLVHLMADKMMNTIILVLWKYLKCLQCQMPFSLEHNNMTEFRGGKGVIVPGIIHGGCIYRYLDIRTPAGGWGWNILG